MRKSIAGVLSAALAALVFAATALAGITRRNPGYARFVPCPESLKEGLICKEEVIEIHRRAIQRRGHAAGGIKAHPPAAPNKPNPAGSINCYVGCSGGHEFFFSATVATASAETCTGAESETRSKFLFSNEPKQLKIATSCRAVSG